MIFKSESQISENLVAVWLKIRYSADWHLSLWNPSIIRDQPWDESIVTQTEALEMNRTSNKEPHTNAGWYEHNIYLALFKNVYPGKGISIIKINPLWDCLIFMMEIS